MVLADCTQTLTTVTRIGALVPRASYNVSAKVFVPNAIFGNFFILVETDVGNRIYEHSNEDNNVGFPKVRLNIEKNVTLDTLPQSL